MEFKPNIDTIYELEEQNYLRERGFLCKCLIN